MRQLKFNVWDKKKNRMFLDAFRLTQRGTQICHQLQAFSSDDLVWLEFTGFKDKNGKDIYDGHQIGYWSMVDGKKTQSRLQVFWNETTGQWCVDLSSEQDKSYCDALWTELRDFDYEIVGNIYENQIKTEI